MQNRRVSKLGELPCLDERVGLLATLDISLLRMSLILRGLGYSESLAYCAPWPEECADTRPVLMARQKSL